MSDPKRLGDAKCPLCSGTPIGSCHPIRDENYRSTLDTQGERLVEEETVGEAARKNYGDPCMRPRPKGPDESYVMCAVLTVLAVLVQPVVWCWLRLRGEAR